jgi:Tetratricopeptide repeat
VVNDCIQRSVEQARRFAAHGDDAAAKLVYLEVLRVDPTNCAVLIELGALAYAGGHRSAARTAYAQAVQYYPGNAIGRVSLANLMLEDGDVSGARLHFEAALDTDPDFPEAHQGLARILTELEDDAAESHWQKGFVGHAIATRRYRGAGPGIPLLLLVAARGGNIATRQWIDDRVFAVTAIYADYHDPAQPVPPHALVVNAIGDADLCGVALARAEELAARSAAAVINQPALVSVTGRAGNAHRLAGVPGVITPRIAVVHRASLLVAVGMGFPLLLRPPGFHTGQHFRYVADRDALSDAAIDLPGEELLVIQYLDARGADGMARKYRVMFIDGVLYPLHLAISADWKVHYFTAGMATNAAFRAEERCFLDDMPGVLGARAMAALHGIEATMGLDYAGVDFALAADGSVLLFEANATMVIIPPEADPMWDYRRRAIGTVLDAAKGMLLRRAGTATAGALAD